MAEAGYLKRGYRVASLFLLALLAFSGCGQGDGDKEFRAAESLKAAGRHAEAVEKFHSFVLHQEKSDLAPEALFQAGEISYLFLNDVRATVDSFRQIIDRYPSSGPAPRAQAYLADINMHRLHDYKQAIVDYQKALGYDDVDMGAQQRFQYEIGAAYFNLKNYEQQRIELNLLLKRHPDTKLRDKIYFQIANSFNIEGKLDEAIASYRQIMKEFPNTPLALEAAFQLASCLEEKEDLPAAIELLKQIKGVYPNPEIVTQRIERMDQRHKKRRR